MREWKAQGARELASEFFWYTAASAVALLVDLSLLVFLVSLGVHYLVAATLAFLIGMGVVYLASIRWIFNWRTHGKRPHIEVGVFLFTGVVGLFLNLGILWFGTSLLGFHYLASKAMSVGCVFSWNFLSRKVMLFSPKSIA